LYLLGDGDRFRPGTGLQVDVAAGVCGIDGLRESIEGCVEQTRLTEGRLAGILKVNLLSWWPGFVNTIVNHVVIEPVRPST